MRHLTRLFAAAVLFAAFTAGAFAQQQPGQGQSNAFREKHKYTFQLMQMVRHIGEIEKDRKYALTPGQASKVLAVLKPLRSKPKLTQDQAKQALKELKKALTANQLNAMARIKPRFRSGFQRNQQGPPQEGQRPPRRQWNASAMKDFNPFYSKASPDDPRAKERQKRWNEFFGALEKKAKSKQTSVPKGAAKTAK